MPNTSSAKKALRSAARKRIFNQRRTKAMRSAVKDVRALADEKKPSEASAALSRAYQAIDKAAKRGVLKKNTAARKKSRLVAALRKAAA